MLASVAVGYSRWRRCWLWARGRGGWGEHLRRARLGVGGVVVRWFLIRDDTEHFASCRSDVFRSGEGPLHRDVLCEHESLPCGYIHFSGLSVMSVVKEGPELLFVCVWVWGDYTLAEGFPVAVMSLLRS